MDLKPLEPVMVDAVVTEASDSCVALTMHEVFGNTHIIVRPGTVHASTATAREKIVEEIRAVKMPDSVRSSVESIINKHLGVRHA
jgi:hypothetical protein